MTKPKQSFIVEDVFFLLNLSTVAIIGGFIAVGYGQVSNIFVAFFRVNYLEVDWLTLGLNVGLFVLTVPPSWMMASKIFRFRILYIGACFTVGYSFLAVSVVNRLLFPYMVSGQILNTFAGAFISAAPTICAALWFTENQVGTAIGVTVMATHFGYILGFTIPTNILAQPTRQENKTFANETSRSWFAEDKVKIGAMFASVVLMLLICDVFLYIYFTDRPPTPPTKAQELKLESDQFSGFLSLKAYIDLVKHYLKTKISCFLV